MISKLINSTAIVKLKNYVQKRLNERSFWVGVGLAVSAAGLLPSPWNILSFIAGVIGSLVPDGNIQDPNDA